MWFNRYKLKTFTCENTQVAYYRGNKSSDYSSQINVEGSK